jgi:hypothetical protein
MVTVQRPKSEIIRKASNSSIVINYPDGASSTGFSPVTINEEFSAIPVQSHRADASFRDFSNLLSNISGKPGFRRSDYEYFRPDEAIPIKQKEIIAMCDSVYQRVGLIKNIIDLMGDFGCQGMRIVHKNPKVEDFYKNWFTRIGGFERSERFLNTLYRLGNVVVRRITAKIPLSDEERIYKGIAVDRKGLPDNNQVEEREIPWKYVFINPAYCDVVGDLSSVYSGKPKYSITIPNKLRRTIVTPKPEEVAIVNELPADILAAARQNKPYILNPEKTLAFHYKKDDWQVWANPMIYAILPHVIVLEKLQLADTAALDGAISKVRIFAFGDIEHKIRPQPAMMAKFAEILQSNTGGGPLDIVWGPDIKIIESEVDLHNFLGEDKYKPSLNAIYGGLGIPPTLTGTFGAVGTTNNLISLKTLTERLEYGRRILSSFWELEFSLIQKAMSFSSPAYIEYDRMNLSDEHAEKALLIQLADRNLISQELLQTRFGNDPYMENLRINREKREIKRGRRSEQLSSFAESKKELMKIALQSGIITPSEANLELGEKKPGEKNALQLRTPPKPPGAAKPAIKKKKGTPGQGRPKNKKDTTKRKTKRFVPKTKAIELWAAQTQKVIAELVNPLLLQGFKKLNMRSLTSEEYEIAEMTRFGVLCNLEALSKVDEEGVYEALSREFSQTAQENYNRMVDETSTHLGRDLSIEELREIQVFCYALEQDIIEEYIQDSIGEEDGEV